LKRPFPRLPALASLPACLALLLGALELRAGEPLVWSLRGPDAAAALSARVLGQPDPGAGDGMGFNGRDTALFVPANPIAGAAAFTIEVLLLPAAEGPAEQRFLHIEDAEKSRLLFETRQTADGRWSLDTFLFSREGQLTLLDRAKTHPPETWTWVALVYADGHMASFVNGAPELEGPIRFPAMSAGTTSIGVRQTLVSWYKGRIREIRFHRVALPAPDLQRAD
jgi:hypothetical protein